MGEHKAGVFIGGILGFFNGATVYGFLTWSTVWETIIITFIGGVCGFAGSECMKWVKKRVF